MSEDRESVRAADVHDGPGYSTDNDYRPQSPASETPGPGEGDLRGEVDLDDAPVHYGLEAACAWAAGYNAAVEQRTLAEQKVARVEALRELSEAATPGDWEFGTAPHPDSNETPAEYVVNALTHNGPLWTTWAHDGSPDVDYVIPALTGDGPTSEANAAFIAAAANYIRAALADPEADR